MTYSGLFVRDNLGQTPTSGQSGWSGCPDVVFSFVPTPSPGHPVIGTPANYVTQQGYATDFGSNVYFSQVNYVYLRALNTTSGAVTGRAWFFFAESDLCLWPTNWQYAPVVVQGVQMNYQPITATAANQVCVTGQPFEWTPPQFHAGHSSGDHYCTITWMENAPVSAPPVSPLQQIPNFNDFTALANFILSHPNMGWRNTVDISAAGPTWQQTSSITGASNGGQISVGVQCNNMPTDGHVGYSIPGPADGSFPNIDTGQLPIYTPNAAFTQPVAWPAKYTTGITISYWQGATKPPAGASIAAVVVLPNTSIAPMALFNAQQTMPWRFAEHRIITPDGFYTGQNYSGVTFGSTPYTF